MLTTGWNTAVEQEVVAVAEPADVDEAVAVIRHAREHGLGVAVQAGGHGATGRTGGSVLLRTGKLTGLTVDPAARRARIGSGVTAGQLQAAVAPHGLTAPAGSSPVVSVAGLALGGGLSWFGRKHGWAADRIVALEVVDADGRPRRVDADSDPELFWALRGAGGDFALVTTLELALFPAPRLYGGRMWWPGEHTPEVADAYRRLTATAPDELSAWLQLAQFPGVPPMVAVDLTYLGDQDDARDLLAPLDRLPRPRSDTRRRMSPADLGSITAEPTNPGVRYSRAELLTELAVPAGPLAPLLSVQLRHLGGALARPSDSPHGALTEPYLLSMLGVPGRGVTARDITAAQDRLAAASPVSGRTPFTFLEPRQAAADAFAPGVLARLRDIKHRYDPGNLFRGSFPVDQCDSRETVSPLPPTKKSRSAPVLAWPTVST